MILVPLLYLLVGLLYCGLRQRACDVIELLIMVVFWPMHVISSEPPVHASVGPLESVDHWITRLHGRGPEAAELIERLLDARARVVLAMASGAKDADMRRWLAPLFEHCARLA